MTKVWIDLTNHLLRFTAVASAVLAIGAGFDAAISASTAAEKAEPAPSGVQVTVAKASNACFSDLVRVTGFVVPRKEAVVIADSDGKVTDVLVREGDVVSDGQDLVRTIGATGPKSLRAPTAGLVTEIRTIPGAPASPMAGPVARIAVGNELEIDAEVPSIHALKVATGATARIIRGDGSDLSGRVRLAAPQIDRKSQLGHVRVSVTSSPSLKSGTFVRVDIDARRSCGVAIPRAAIDHSTVQVVKGNTVETRKVRVGLVSDTSIEILEGVREGEIVVADAGTSLHDGDLIKPTFPDEFDRSRGR